MAEQISVVMIDPEESSRRLMKELLQKIHRVKIAAEAEELARGYELVKKHKPAVVILDLFSGEEQALKVAEKITQNFPHTTLFATASHPKSEVIINAVRAGAREFLPKPISKDEFLKAIKKFIQWEIRRTNEEETNGKIISVFGVKGGVGKTTIATNLAVTLAQTTSKSVILLDLNLQLGNAALFLNMQTKYSIIDVAQNIEDLDPAILKDILPKHDSGVYLLGGSPRIEEAESLLGTHLDQIITLLRANFDYIIIDTNESLNEFSLKALDEADSILTVLTVDLPCIYNARRCLDIFKRMEYDQDKLLIVVNRYNSNNGVALDQLQKSIDYPIFWKVPNEDYATVIGSINQGVPMSTISPRSKASQNIKKLAERLNGSISIDDEQKNQNQKTNVIKSFFSKGKGK